MSYALNRDQSLQVGGGGSFTPTRSAAVTSRSNTASPVRQPAVMLKTNAPVINYLKIIIDLTNVFRVNVSKISKGSFLNALSNIGVTSNFAFNPNYSQAVAEYVATYYLKGLHTYILNQLGGFPSVNNIGELLSVKSISAVNKLITQLHIARQYYCFMASRTTGLEQAKNQAKKVIVSAYANWIATGYSNAVKNLGGNVSLSNTQITASNTVNGIEVYDWKGQTQIAKFQAFASPVSNASKPYEVAIGPVKTIPAPVVTDVKYTMAPVTENPNTTTQTPATSEVPDGAQSLVTNLQDDAKKIAAGEKPTKWWWWLAGAAIGGYLLKGSGKSQKQTSI